MNAQAVLTFAQEALLLLLTLFNALLFDTLTLLFKLLCIEL